MELKKYVKTGTHGAPDWEIQGLKLKALKTFSDYKSLETFPEIYQESNTDPNSTRVRTITTKCFANGLFWKRVILFQDRGYDCTDAIMVPCTAN